MHFCPVEIMALLSALPFVRWVVRPCCMTVLEKWHKHYKGHKEKQKDPFKYLGNHVIEVERTSADRPRHINSPPPPPGGWK